jgi:hypothetical protein
VEEGAGSGTGLGPGGRVFHYNLMSIESCTIWTTAYDFFDMTPDDSISLVNDNDKGG